MVGDVNAASSRLTVLSVWEMLPAGSRRGCTLWFGGSREKQKP